MHKIFIWICGLILIMILAKPLYSQNEIVVVLSDGSTYGVTYLGVDNQTYSYRVREISGKNLSHFVLEMPLCIEKEAFVSWTPENGVLGEDFTTGGNGIKWNTESEFTDGIFSFTLDEHYAIGQIEIYFKAGTFVNSVFIDGPVCDTIVPTSTQTPTETNTVTPTSTVMEDTVTPTSTSTVVEETPTPTATATETIVVKDTETATPTKTATVTPTLTVEAPTNEVETAEPKLFKMFLSLIRGK